MPLSSLTNYAFILVLLCAALLSNIRGRAETSTSLEVVIGAEIKNNTVKRKGSTDRHGGSFRFRGEQVAEIENSSQIREFRFLAWIRSDGRPSTQRMIAAKNRYSLNQREWSLMVDEDGYIRLYIYRQGWEKVAASKSVSPGEWVQVGFEILPNHIDLWVNGELAARAEYSAPILATDAAITIGGVNDAGSPKQAFLGEIENIRILPARAGEDVFAKDYQVLKSTKGEALVDIQPFELWDASREVPGADELLTVDSVVLWQIRAQEPANQYGSYPFMHGVALAWYRGRLYASFAYNQNRENTPGEKVICMVSDNNGASWYQTHVIAEGDPRTGSSISHGVFHSSGDKLWALLPGFKGAMSKVHTRLYLLDERTNTWKFQGVVAREGFWPLQEPQKMDNGNWIMAGFSVEHGNVPAVAISKGEDILSWDVIPIPRADSSEAWSESTVIVEGKRITNISRHGPTRLAYVANSDDYGRTWTPARRSNLPMADSKPYGGTLSSGERYLVGTTTADTVDGRSPLTIALSRPHEEKFSRILIIRSGLLKIQHSTLAGALQPERKSGPASGGSGPDSAPDARLSYPYVIEKYGMLYVGYSNSGNRGAWNPNSIEIAIMPVAKLVKTKY